MKICPRCQKTYSDDSLNFCLEDGSVLTQMASQPQPPPTMINQVPPVTQQQMSQPSQPASQAGWNTAPQQYSMQPPKKSSKAWVWVLLILGLVVLVCGGGFAGLIYIGSQVDTNKNLSTNDPNRQLTNKTTTNSNSNSNTNSTTSTTERTSIDKLDLAKWEQTDPIYGDATFVDGELTMASVKKNFYYVLAGTPKQTTGNADSRVTVRNVDNGDTSLGFGLVFHSDVTPLQQGYAFLIDSKKKRYRIVHHAPHKETPDINWTKSDAILDGSQENTLEVRDTAGSVDFYINGKKVNTLKTTNGFPNGVIGLYGGDALKIAFKDLEIHR